MITYFNTNPTSDLNYRYGLNTNCGVGRNWRDDSSVPGSDTCMDDHTVGAAGHAWIAAYQNKRGNTASRNTNISKATTALDDAFKISDPVHEQDSICLHDPQVGMLPSGRGPCNVTDPNQIATVLTRTSPAPGYTFSLNRGQNQAYGFGLVASVSAASIGLEEAGATWSLSPNQKLLVQALLEEAQRKGVSSGAYFFGGTGDPSGASNGKCARWTSVGTSVVNPNNGTCADGHHRPRHYSLVGAASWTAPNTFFSRYLPGVSAKPSVTDPTNNLTIDPAFQFNAFSFSDFKLDPLDGTLRPHWARGVWYGNLAYYWHTIVYNRNRDDTAPAAGELRPRLAATYDDYNPIGYIDGITSTGVAYGWTCDQDVPGKSIYVDLYWDSASGGTRIGRAHAIATSEAAINNLCGPGSSTLHRWSYQLPGPATNRAVYAFGLDATWRGFTELTRSSCAAPACRW